MPERRLRGGLLAGLPAAVLFLAATAAAGYGLYLIATDRARTIGIFLVGLGLAFVPVPVISIIGSIICLAAGGYSFYRYGVNLQGVVFLIVGLISLADRAQDLVIRRSAGPDPGT